MTAQVRPGKRTERQDLQLFLRREGDGCLNQLAADAAPFESRRHFRVHHDETAVAPLVRQERHTLVGAHFESLLGGVVACVHG